MNQHMDSVKAHELYSPNTWKYRLHWAGESGTARTVTELLNGKIQSSYYPICVMDNHLSAEEFVALYEWLPINQRDETEYRDTDGWLVEVKFEFTMTGKQRSDWFFD